MLQEYSGYTFPLAVAIVLSGQYEDDLDNSEDVVYTGQGGNNLLGNKRQVQDQVMERGNLALKVCISEIWFSVLVVFFFFHCNVLIDSLDYFVFNLFLWNLWLTDFLISRNILEKAWARNFLVCGTDLFDYIYKIASS